jgi:ABC-2 type transport system permease protein
MGAAIAEGSALSMLYFALCALVPSGIVYALLSHNFIRIATSNRGAVKIKYREKALKVSGIRAAFLKKELRHFASSPMYILNASMGAVFMLILAGVLIVKREIITNFVASVPELNFALPTLIAAALCLLAATNFVSAPSISLEGTNLWIAKSLPVRPFDVLLSKALLHITICVPFVVVSAAASAIALRPTFGQTALLLLLPTAFTVLMALFGVVINLRFPKFDWISETHAVKQSISTMITMFGSVALIALLAVIYAVLLTNVTTPELYLAFVTVFFVVLSVILYRYLKTGGSRAFEAL